MLIISELRLDTAGIPNAKWVVKQLISVQISLLSIDSVVTMKLFKKKGNKKSSATFNK